MRCNKKNEEQLKKDLFQKINGIRTLYFQAIRFDYESSERIEFSNLIATSLRAVLFGDKKNEYKSLIHRVGYYKKLLFPLYDPLACTNLLPSYNLLQFSINNDGVKVQISDDLLRTDIHWGAYLTFESWLNEIVIDTKIKDIEPMSRLLIVKIVADTIGAHVDDEIENHLFIMSQFDLLPVVIRNGAEIPRNLEIKAKSIFCETILAIARELIDSFEMWKNISPKRMGLSNLEIRLQRYKGANNRFELIKYGYVERTNTVPINLYNSNQFYECSIYSKIAPLYEVSKNRIQFSIGKIDYTDVLSGDYLGKSLYPST